MALAYIDCENCKIHPVLVSSLQAAVSAESNLLLAQQELFCAQNLAWRKKMPTLAALLTTWRSIQRVANQLPMRLISMVLTNMIGAADLRMELEMLMRVRFRFRFFFSCIWNVSNLKKEIINRIAASRKKQLSFYDQYSLSMKEQSGASVLELQIQRIQREMIFFSRSMPNVKLSCDSYTLLYFCQNQNRYFFSKYGVKSKFLNVLFNLFVNYVKIKIYKDNTRDEKWLTYIDIYNTVLHRIRPPPKKKKTIPPPWACRWWWW